MRQFKVEWCANYGINKRTGWSICVNGRVVADIEPWLAVAFWKAFCDWRLPGRA